MFVLLTACLAWTIQYNSRISAKVTLTTLWYVFSSTFKIISIVKCETLSTDCVLFSISKYYPCQKKKKKTSMTFYLVKLLNFDSATIKLCSYFNYLFLLVFAYSVDNSSFKTTAILQIRNLIFSLIT